MNISLSHKFVNRCYDKASLLHNVNKMSTFCTNLEKQAKSDPDRFPINDYLGDGFECFGEALIKLSPVDNRIGITDYSPNRKIDKGVDGSGTGFNGRPATVQFKYKSKGPSVALSSNEDHLTNFLAQSIMEYDVSKEDNTNMLIITTAPGLHFFTEQEMLYGKVRCLGLEQLKQLVDNNQAFWDAFRKLLG